MKPLQGVPERIRKETLYLNGKLDGNTNKKSKKTSKNDKTEEKSKNILGKREKSNTIDTNDTTQGNKSEVLPKDG